MDSKTAEKWQKNIVIILLGFIVLISISMVSLAIFYGDRVAEDASSSKITTNEDCERFWALSHTDYWALSHTDYWALSHTDYWALSHTDYWTLSAPHNRPLQEFVKKCTG